MPVDGQREVALWRQKSYGMLSLLGKHISARRNCLSPLLIVEIDTIKGYFANVMALILEKARKTTFFFWEEGSTPCNFFFFFLMRLHHHHHHHHHHHVVVVAVAVINSAILQHPGAHCSF